MNNKNNPTQPRVVVIGAGFGGLRVTRNFQGKPVQVTLVDKNNYHLFQPLLYQVASAGLSPDEIARPVRAIIKNEGNADFHLGEVTGIDFDARQVQTALGIIPYDYLVLAAGSDNNFFGMQDVAENSLTLKSIPDALAIRNHVLRHFELASLETDPAIRRKLLTFVIVGGGPTGIESSGALSELFLNVLKKDYPRLDFSEVRIILLEASDRLLSMMPAEQGEYAGKILRKHNVDVRCGAVVSSYDGEMVTLNNGETIEARTLIWAAGVRANPLLDRLGLKQDRSGRVIVSTTLQVPDHPEVFVIGDAAAFPGPNGIPLPMIAPVAIQQAKTVTDNILKLIQAQPLAAFEYHDPGILATIGRHHAVAYIGGIKFRGYLAWMVWLVVHIMQLIGFRNRVVVLVDWAWQYIFYDRALRLIEQPITMKDLPEYNRIK